MFYQFSLFSLLLMVQTFQLDYCKRKFPFFCNFSPTILLRKFSKLYATAYINRLDMNNIKEDLQSLANFPMPLSINDRKKCSVIAVNPHTCVQMMMMMIISKISQDLLKYHQKQILGVKFLTK